ncbi:PREDICTED: dirigent protein 22-like isoform X2 [Brassica oleracea var. oleracea]|uniref:dirigent protein 22-like isoform X2 n=1 Tax=Brassica oleracea var. oleracea TaxID=109376 RepID=UPI0006A73D01|nr:PREDICTED: dirigent protein 22-like isoform X2 [Brassica oleracea var. oleracea]
MSMLILILAVQILLLTTFASAGDRGDFARTMNPKRLHMKEKLTHLRVYWHDVISGPNPSAIVIKKHVAKNSFFLVVTMIDNALTSDVPINSTLVGQAQGFYAGASQHETSFLMAMNFAFKIGKYNGSTITILGRNTIFSEVRKMPVVGGRGIFRLARGYVELRTKWFDQQSGDATVDDNCFVLHY